MSDHEKRVHDLLYSTQSRTEMCERVVELEDENAMMREQLEYERQTSRSRLERIDQLKAENAKLRDWCSELLHMAESNDPDFLHWPEIHDELEKLGVKIVSVEC